MRKKELSETLERKDILPVIECIVFCTSDRGSKLFYGKVG